MRDKAAPGPLKRASAPKAPGRLGREDARTFGGVTSLVAILPAMALILRESDVQELIEMDDVIAAVEAAMRELGEGEAQNEPRRRAFAPAGLLNVMFAAWPGGKCTGLKAYTVATGRCSRPHGSNRTPWSWRSDRTSATGLRSRPTSSSGPRRWSSTSWPPLSSRAAI